MIYIFLGFCMIFLPCPSAAKLGALEQANNHDDNVSDDEARLFKAANALQDCNVFFGLFAE
jgi:hypothetical protein